MTDDTHKLEIDWLRTVGGALAAVSSAVLLSTLGAAGTIIGAALGSVVVTGGGALYSQGVARSRARLRQAQTAALRKVRVAQAEVRRAGRTSGDGRRVDAHLAHAQATLDRAKDDLGTLSDEPDGSGWRGRVTLLPWQRIALAAAGPFAAAVVATTAFVPLVAECVPTINGGSRGDGPTIGRIVGNTSDPVGPREDVPASDQPSPSPSGEPSTQPSEQATPSPTPSDQATPSPSPTEVPTPEPTTPAAEPTTSPSSDPGLAPPPASAPAG
jgi:hypothetical protein